MICILKTILAWVILLLVGMNLIGLIVRGFFWTRPVINVPANDPLEGILGRECRRMSVVNSLLTLFSIVLAAAYLFALLHFWNSGLASAAGIIMAARMPDLIFEIRTGTKVTRANAPQTPVHIIATIVSLGTIPLVWYSLCKWTP